METREYFEKVIGSHLGAENIAFMFLLFESCKLNEKCGYKQEGTLRETVYKNGKYQDQYVLALVNNK